MLSFLKDRLFQCFQLFLILSSLPHPGFSGHISVFDLKCETHNWLGVSREKKAGRQNFIFIFYN